MTVNSGLSASADKECDWGLLGSPRSISTKEKENGPAVSSIHKVTHNIRNMVKRHDVSVAFSGGRKSTTNGTCAQRWVFQFTCEWVHIEQPGHCEGERPDTSDQIRLTGYIVVGGLSPLRLQAYFADHNSGTSRRSAEQLREVNHVISQKNRLSLG